MSALGQYPESSKTPGATKPVYFLHKEVSMPLAEIEELTSEAYDPEDVYSGDRIAMEYSKILSSQWTDPQARAAEGPWYSKNIGPPTVEESNQLDAKFSEGKYELGWTDVAVEGETITIDYFAVVDPADLNVPPQPVAQAGLGQMPFWIGFGVAAFGAMSLVNKRESLGLRALAGVTAGVCGGLLVQQALPKPSPAPVEPLDKEVV